MAQQLALGGSDFRSGIQVSRVVDDFGPLGAGGASDPRYVRCENGSEYIVKGPSITPQEPYVAVNELVAAQIGGTLGLPILPFCVVDFQGHACFGSEYMLPGTFDPIVDETFLRGCENQDRVYDLVVFDVWLCNNDRHSLNLIVRQPPAHRGAPKRNLLMMNDHSRCLIQPNMKPGDLSPALGGALISPYIIVQFIRDAIRDAASLKSAIDKATRIGADQIQRAIECIPQVLLSPQDGRLIADFLIDRQTRLRTIFRAERHVFMNLGVGEI